MLKLILGRSGVGKTTVICRRLCAAGQERPQLLLVPEQSSHETERELCRAGGNGVSLYAEVLSFSRLCNRVFLEAGGLGDQELDGGGRLLLMYNAVKAVSSQLTVCQRSAGRPAFLQSLLATVDELKSCCVLPEQLSHAAEDLEGPEGEKLRDLGLICTAYDALTAQVALDPRDRLTRAAEKLKTCRWAEGKDVWLDGFTDFTPQQMLVLERLLDQAGQLTVALTCDHLEEDEDGTGIFSTARRTAAGLIALAKKRGIGCEVEHLVPPQDLRRPPLDFLEKNLFGHARPQPSVSQGALELFAAQSLRSEVEWTAARILRLVREEGLRFREIGVVARNFGAYSGLVESVFPRYGVPVFCSAMHDILEKPVLSLVTAALDTVAGGYLYEDVFRYLKTGLTGLEDSDRDLLENYVLKWDVRGGRWTQEMPWAMHPRGYGYPMEDRDRELLEKLDMLRRQVAAPLELLRKNPEKTGEGQAKALYSFMEQIGLPQRLAQRVAELNRRGEPALAQEYRQLWDILCGAMEQCAALLGGAPMEMEEFAGIFRLVLSQYDVGAIPVSLDRVTAGETTRQTNHRVKALFLLGADDASIPQVGGETGLLSDDDRSLLASFGLELNQSGEERLYREMTTVYQICALPREHLFLSWPAQGGGGGERRPCFVVERLKLLFSDLKEVREEETGGQFRLAAPLPALEQAGRRPGVRKALSALPQYAPQVERLEQAARWQRGRLSRQSVEQLYGKRVPMSASRMDKYRSCHFSYFMKFGLKAEPRKPAGFTAPEYGTFVHYVLEYVLKHEQCALQDSDAGAKDALWDEERREKVHRLTKEAVERYVQEELGGLENQNDRFRYLFRRLTRSVQAVVDNVVQELALSKFRPVSFELGFANQGDLPPVELTANGVTLSISGFVDRVDGWVHDGRLYLRVVDYKTGRKSFDLTEVWNGLGLQMLLYLFTLKDKGQSIYGLPIEGAGVLYLPARDAIVRGSRAMSEEQRQRAVDKELVRRGLVLDDPAVLEAMEQTGGTSYRFLPLKVSRSTGQISGEALVSAQRLGRLQKHIERVLEEICAELAAGNIAADPFWRGPEKNACRFCDYAAACHFEEGRGGDCRRWLPSVTAQQFWEKIEKGPQQSGENDGNRAL